MTEVRALMKVSWVELKLFTREPISVLFTFTFPLVLLVVLGGVFSQPSPRFPHSSGADYYLPAYVVIVLAVLGIIALPAHIASYRERGILRRFGAAGLLRTTWLGAQLIVTFTIAIVGTVVLVVVAALLYHASLPHQPAVVLLAFILDGLCIGAIGLLLATIFRTARSAQGAGLVIFFPAWLLCGAGPPPEALPSTMRHVADALPLSHMVRILQDPWLGTPMPLVSLVVVLAVLAMASVASGLLSLRTGEL